MTELLVRQRLPQPTILFDEYWKFAVERQQIYLRRLAGEKPPWTADPILQTHRFTNAYRAADRVSQYLIRGVQYADGNHSGPDVVLSTLLFKLFNKIETWELIVGDIGWPSAVKFPGREIAAVLDRAFSADDRIYSAAYIMPSATGFGSERKHRNHIALLNQLVHDGTIERLVSAKSLHELYCILLGCPSLGEFLAFQFAIDLNYSAVFDFSEMEFVVAGPGAKEGLAKCFHHLGDLTEADVIRWVTDTQEQHLDRRCLTFPTLWGRPLQLVDVQNLFCEIGKYARLSHPEFTKVGGRSRIKQHYRPSKQRPTAWFPPKWGLNERIARRPWFGVEAASLLIPAGGED